MQGQASFTLCCLACAAAVCSSGTESHCSLHYRSCSEQPCFVPLLQSKFSKESCGAPSIFWKLLNVCGLVPHVKTKQNQRKPSEEKMLHGVQMRRSPVRERRNPTVIELCGVQWESFLVDSESDPMACANVLC